MLKLRGEADDDLLDEDQPELIDRISVRDAFPEDEGVALGDVGEDDADQTARHGGGPSVLRGLGIAAATFLPTFLAIFFGLPYLVGSEIPGLSPGDPATPISSELGNRDSSPKPDTVRDPFVPPRAVNPPASRPAEPSRPAERDAASTRVDPEPAKPALPPSGATSQPSRQPAAPDPAPAEPRLAERQAPEPPAAEARVPETPRPSAARRRAPERSAATEARDSAPGWSPAAAFTDRAAASRLASSIEQQGYPVEIRQDRASTRPWVVWIGDEPRSSGRR